MAKLFANSGDPDQTPRSAASDLGLHCLPITLLWVSRLQWVNISLFQYLSPQCLNVNVRRIRLVFFKTRSKSFPLSRKHFMKGHGLVSCCFQWTAQRHCPRRRQCACEDNH